MSGGFSDLSSAARDRHDCHKRRPHCAQPAAMRVIDGVGPLRSKAAQKPSATDSPGSVRLPGIGTAWPGRWRNHSKPSFQSASEGLRNPGAQRPESTSPQPGAAGWMELSSCQRAAADSQSLRWAARINSGGEGHGRRSPFARVVKRAATSGLSPAPADRLRPRGQRAPAGADRAGRPRSLCRWGGSQRWP